MENLIQQAVMQGCTRPCNAMMCIEVRRVSQACTVFKRFYVLRAHMLFCLVCCWYLLNCSALYINKLFPLIIL